MANPADHNELLSLIASLCEGTISGEQGNRLAARLRGDETARLTYVRYMDLHASLGATHRASRRLIDPAVSADIISLVGTVDSVQDDIEVEQGRSAGGYPNAECSSGDTDLHLPIKYQLASNGRVHGEVVPADSTNRHSLFRRYRLVTGIAAACLAVSIGLSLFYRPRAHVPALVGQGSRVQDAAIVAELSGDKDCLWVGGEESIAVGTPLRAGTKLGLASGVAKFLFRDGTTVLVESPAIFEVVSASALRVESGTVVARANGPKKDFQVISPDATIVDLGTSFGVHCDVRGATEVEVFEGAVEVVPDDHSKKRRVLGMGHSVRVHHEGKTTDIDLYVSEEDRFGSLLKLLWEDVPANTAADEDGESDGVVQAEFEDAPVAGMIDTFYGARRGRGWLTPWVAHGNPLGEIRRDNPLSGDGNQYLTVRFYHSQARVIAREYGACRGFDPSQPHMISWRWRFEGTIEDFTGSYDNRIMFYSNPYFRRGSWADNSWLIGVVGGHETRGDRRQFYPMHWYVFDGTKGDAFHLSNLVDTGMMLKPGVVYRFAVVVYPSLARYDVAIRDDVNTFTRTNLPFRNPQGEQAHVLHFGLNTAEETSDASFSLDALRIESLDKLAPEDFLSSGNVDMEEFPTK